MYLDKVKKFLEKHGLQDRLLVFEESSATVALAAQAVGTEEARIAKSMSFDLGDRVILVVTAGDARVDNRKFRETFSTKARMLARERVEEEVGYDVGGVCPFDVNPGVDIYLDVSMKRFPTIYPAGGTAASAVELSPQELEKLTSEQWVDVCRDWD